MNDVRVYLLETPGQGRRIPNATQALDVSRLYATAAEDYPDHLLS